MKRVFIIHRWEGTPKSDWYYALKEQLEDNGFSVEIPEMPNTEEPNVAAWTNHLKKVVGKVNKETYFIGHSIGCQTIMRYLQTQNEKSGGAVFVAGWFKLVNLEGEEVENIAAPWMKDNLDFQKIKNNLPNLTVILSSNEPYNYVKENANTFKQKLNAKVIIEKNKGHFTEDDEVTTNETALQEILKIIKA